MRGWVDFATGLPVSQGEFLGVLSNVQLLGIEAETYRFFFDEVIGLDNVMLRSVPEPSSLLLLTLAAAPLMFRRRRSR